MPLLLLLPRLLYELFSGQPLPDVTKGEGVLFGKLQYLVYVENSYLCRVRCVSRNKPAEPIDAFIPLFERRSKKLSTPREKNDHEGLLYKPSRSNRFKFSFFRFGLIHLRSIRYRS